MRLALLSLTSLVFLSGCAAKWVKRPEADGVKRLAIASTYMDVDITSDYGKAASGGGLQVIQNLVGNKDADVKKGDQPRVEIAAAAAKIFSEALGKLPGWKTIPLEDVVGSKDYRAMFQGSSQTSNRTLAAIVDIGQKIAARNYVTPPKMYMIPMDATEDGKRLQKLAELCKVLKVDAVAVIHVSLGYNDGWISIGSNTKASPMAAAELRIVTKKGQVAVITPAITKDSFKEVEGEVWVTGRELRLDEKAIGLYQEALKMVATEITAKLREELTAPK
jgi:hypothetical protein